MRVIGLKLIRPVMFCCSTKWRFLASLLLVTGIGVAVFLLWPRTDASPSVTVPESSGTAATEQTSAEALAEGLALVSAANDSFDARIQDYTASFEKQERVDGVLLPRETMAIKIRQQPFSVYIHHLAPEDLQGQEAIYVEGQNDGKLIAHHGSSLLGWLPLRLVPEGPVAMMGNRYSIKSAGMKNLLGQLLKLADEQQENLARCDIRWIDCEPVDNRPVRCLEIRSPAPLPGFPLAIARIYFDSGYNAPVRYEAFEWPEDTSSEPILVEYYQYTSVKLNAGLSDIDFDPENEAYDYN